MSKELPEISEFDLTPDPRILPMLGEINLAQWRCIAELVDNSIDGFLDAHRTGKPILQPEISISMPSTDIASAHLRILDNGPGMSPQNLAKAARAGYSGQNSTDSLGLFGMGFNIATARLGSVTKVWTTQEGDRVWHGLEIDFERLMRQKHFKTQALTRAKLDPSEHGTEIVIERLKPEQRQWFAQAANRSRVSKELSRAYAAMLRADGRPISFKLKVMGRQVLAKAHCIWSEHREVITRSAGTLSAFQTIDVRLPERPYCNVHGSWLAADASRCPMCEEAGMLPGNVTTRVRRVYGWIGIQRYLHQDEYGIDLLRNGRKIEIGSKELFRWFNGEADEIEYPTDDFRNRGRIVGEIHIDHCRVTYTKDRFDRNDPAWSEMVQIARGEGPLRPEKASNLGFGPNTSPLYKLYQAFRRNSPHKKVAGAYEKLCLIKDNDLALQFGQRFHDEESEYQSDERFWELVVEADRELLITPTTPRGPQNGPNDEGLPPGFGDDPGSIAPTDVPPTNAIPPAPPITINRVPLHSLTRVYRDELTDQRWDVKAFSADFLDPDLGRRAWLFKRQPSGEWQFLVNTEHSAFQSATLTPVDALIAQLAHTAMEFVRNNLVEPPSFAQVLTGLRENFATSTTLNGAELSMRSSNVLDDVCENLAHVVGSDGGRLLYSELLPAEQHAVGLNMATRSVPNPQQVISDGRFFVYAPRRVLLRLLGSHPELFFDGKIWNTEYQTLDYSYPAATEEARAKIVSYYSGLLGDAIWLSELTPADYEIFSKDKLRRAAIALDLLLEDSNLGAGGE